jgi:nucleotide sugar dehydrogenase
MNKMNKILICGYGNIGKHIYSEFNSLYPTIFDPKYEEYSVKPGFHEIAFICVPTDMKSDRSCNTDIVETVLSDIDAGVFVIRSAVPPGTAALLSRKYGKPIVVSPEYYGTTQHSKRMLDFVILGGDRLDCGKVAETYSLVKNGNFRCVFTTWETAELAKYMENCFLALKVTFCNEFARVAKSIGVEYTELRELFVLDERMGASHTWVYNEKPYYDSHCLNKDIPAFVRFSKEHQVYPALMEAVDKINNTEKAVYDK